MAKGRVVVIDGDDWVAKLLSEGLRDHGFEVSTCLSGGKAIAAVLAIAPDCVVCEVVLPELDGPSIARALRGGAGAVSGVPILFLSNADDVVSRQAAFAAGGDVYLTKPFRVDEIALQVQALVGMAGRLAGHAPQVDVSQPEVALAYESAIPGGHAIEGNIAQMSVATVLTLLEMERRSGSLKVRSGNRKCILDIVAGYAIRGEIDASVVAPLAVLREILRWKDGRFRFRPGMDGAVPTNRRSIGALLLEAVRLDDELAQAVDAWVGDELQPARPSWPKCPGPGQGPAKRAVPSAQARQSKLPAKRSSEPPPAKPQAAAAKAQPPPQAAAAKAQPPPLPAAAKAQPPPLPAAAKAQPPPL
ncbi:MAG: response regulator, partial [Polyangiaceae bacterium]|nr:response regulator [Polyangiaceae bacterium]